MSWQAWRSMVHHEDIERVEARLRATLAGAPYAGVEISHLAAPMGENCGGSNPLPRYSEG